MRRIAKSVVAPEGRPRAGGCHSGCRSPLRGYEPFTWVAQPGVALRSTPGYPRTPLRGNEESISALRSRTCAALHPWLHTDAPPGLHTRGAVGQFMTVPSIPTRKARAPEPDRMWGIHLTALPGSVRFNHNHSPSPAALPGDDPLSFSPTPRAPTPCFRDHVAH